MNLEELDYYGMKCASGISGELLQFVVAAVVTLLLVPVEIFMV
jgi:hypothetical protein